MRVLKWLWKQITEGAVYSDPEAYALVHSEPAPLSGEEYNEIEGEWCP